MKQVVQSYKTGEVSLRSVPNPRCDDKFILVRNINSLVSIGTERSTIELGKKSLVGKAILRPDLVHRALSKAKKEGFTKTWQEAMGRLDTPTPLGYSSAGMVIEAGISATEFSPGDQVACIGQGYASHADYILVPVNLACKIPKNVSIEEASFGMLGIIALHGIRSANLTFGSKVAVLGLGLLGLLTAQILRAYGTEVIAYDPDLEKVNLARKQGILSATRDTEEFESLVKKYSHGAGVDAVIITTAAKDSSPIELAVKLSRFKGRIVVVGTADIHPNRNEMWEKELELVVSKAGGAGSLDDLYEVEGIDLPISEVRWTEKRNLKEFLRLLSEERLSIKELITHRYSIEAAEEVYRGLMNGEMRSPVGVLFDYKYSQNTLNKEDVAGAEDRQKFHHEDRVPLIKKKYLDKKSINIGVIGAGLFGKTLLLPTLKKFSNVNMHTLVTSSGISADHSGNKFGFKNQGTSPRSIWENKEIDAVIGLTPHSDHMNVVTEALISAKPLFLEKPLCISIAELDKIKKVLVESTANLIMVGHNRRYSPHTLQARKWLSGRKTPLVMQMRINSGYISHAHWVHSEAEGRSRIVGEMSHFIDLASAIIGSNIVRVFAERLSSDDGVTVNNDNVAVSMKFDDGSICSFIYSASGDKSYSRESFEIFCEGKTIVSKDYRVSELHQDGKVSRFKTNTQELGYKEELQKFIDCYFGFDNLEVSIYEEINTMNIIFGIEASLSSAKSINIR